MREPYERDGRIVIEDPHVREFGTEAAAIPDRCADPDCDGDAGHDGPHYQWVVE